MRAIIKKKICLKAKDHTGETGYFLYSKSVSLLATLSCGSYPVS